MRRLIGLAALLTFGVVVVTQALSYSFWHDMDGGYDRSIVIAGVLIPTLTCFPISMVLLLQRDRLALALDQLNTAHRLLHERSLRDPMTGLLHRQAFLDHLQERRATCPNGAFLLVDIDHFKAINDVHGHAAGDQALLLLAAALRTATRSGDLVARFGGEEFCIFSPVSVAGEGKRLAEHVRAAIEALVFAPRGQALRLTASIGVAEAASTEPSCTAIARADNALYAAKRQGRNRVVADDAEPSAPSLPRSRAA